MPQITPRKAANNKKFAALISLLIVSFFFLMSIKSIEGNLERFSLIIILGAGVSYAAYKVLTAKYRHRDKVLSQVFPPTWRTILQQQVVFYNGLSETEQQRFEQNIQIFLAEKRITGIKTGIDDKIRVLVAASAIIPIFGFEEWEYDNLGEVLIYPNTFSKDYEIEGEGRNVLGMVGTGVMRNVMILSKKALLDGFSNAKDGKNTAIHEFVHLIDASDGDFDGIPLLLDKQYITPWLDLMYQEIQNINQGTSSLNPYGATNEIEFFAVASEYFFEKPMVMKKKYPELYTMLVRIFHQDFKQQFKYQMKDLVGYTGKKIGRNAPCPCRSGKKYKHCCLRS